MSRFLEVKIMTALKDSLHVDEFFLEFDRIVPETLKEIQLLKASLFTS